MSYVCDLFFIFTFIFIVHNLIKTDTPAFLHIYRVSTIILDKIVGKESE